MSRSNIKFLVTLALLLFVAVLIAGIVPNLGKDVVGGGGGGATSDGTTDTACKHQNLYKTYESRNDEIHYVTSRCESCMEIVEDKVSKDHEYLNGVCVNCDNKCSHSGVGDDGVCFTCNASTSVFVIGTKRYAVPANTKWATAASMGLVPNLAMSDYIYFGVVGGNILYEVSMGQCVETSAFIKNGGVYAFCSHNYNSSYVDLLDGRNHSLSIQCTICSHISRVEEKTSHIYAPGTDVCTVCGYVCAHVARNNGFTKTHSTHTLCELCSYCGTAVELSGEAPSEHIWENGVCSVCDYACGHNLNVSNGTCVTCGWICTHDWDLTGVCRICGFHCKHSNEVVVWTDYGDGTHGDVRTCPDCHYNYVPDKVTHKLISCDDDYMVNGMYHIRHVKCQYCPYETTYTELHTYKYTSGTESTHKAECTLCDYSDYHSHSKFYEAGYDNWRCQDCGYTCTNHNYASGTCLICGRPENY